MCIRDSPNVISVLNTWTTVDAAKAFLASEEIKTGMGEAGVTAPPTFVFANSE